MAKENNVIIRESRAKKRICVEVDGATLELIERAIRDNDYAGYAHFLREAIRRMLEELGYIREIDGEGGGLCIGAPGEKCIIAYLQKLAEAAEAW